MNLATIAPRDLQERILRGELVELIDVRTPVEFREVHAAVARNVPLDRLDVAAVRDRRSAESPPLYCICRSGSRGRQACEQLAAGGVPNVVNVEGGTLAWEQAGLPVVRGRKAISLERQVRIAAGSLVLIGVGLGAFVHAYCLGLAAFVGAGLVFAGVTDTCGMALLLGRMPWNQVRSDPPAASTAPGAETVCRT